MRALATGLLLAFPLLAAGAIGADEPTGLETCAVCHDEVAPAFVAGPHGRAMAARSAATLERSCATCHEAGEEHVDDPSPANVRRTPSSEACASCHPDAPGALRLGTPGHDRHRVECLSCHASGHDLRVAEPLLAAPAPRLCAGCHQREAASFALPFAHRERGAAMACTRCHAIHGGGEVGRALLLGDGGACVECHSEKAGPYIFPHPPRALDGCLACHEPHGSTNPRQLVRRRVANLCLECHAGVPAFHDLTEARYQACQTCHLAVHGSNRDPRLIEE